MSMRRHVRFQRKALLALEYALAFAVLLGTVAFGVTSLMRAPSLDWSSAASFNGFLETVLVLAIGIELARLLLSYSLDTLVELMAFVIARKLLLLQHDFVGLILGIISLAILFGARHFFYRAFDEEAS